MNSEVIQSAVQENNVYVGPWTDWSHGSIRGATLTLSHRDGGFVIAFLALFVTIIGARFWTILSYILHINMSRETAQNAIYHQRQAILRNTSSSGTALWKFSRISWAQWRRGRVSTLKQTFPPLLLSFAILIAFTIAGIFSSRVATSNNGEVLLSSSNCGIFNPGVNASFLDSTNAYMVRRMQFSSNYALMCYGKDNFAEGCPTFPRKSLPFNVTRNLPCPFPGMEGICRKPADAIRLDSGFIKSHLDLGINTAPESRFLYRKVTECAPLLNEGFTQRIISSRGLNSSIPEALLNFFYGETYSYINATYQYLADPPLTRSYERGNFGIFDYVLHSEVHYGEPAGDSDSSRAEWSPIAQLLIPDGDVNLLFLSANDIQFLNRVEDPWYSAQAFMGNTTSFRTNGTELPGGIPFYVRDDPTRALGCVERYQICNPNLPSESSCTPLNGIFQVAQMVPRLYQDEVQRAQVGWSASAIVNMAAGISEVAIHLGVGALQSRNRLEGRKQSSLPANQWELEAESWFKTTLADLQRVIVEQATGPTDPAMRQLLVRPKTAEQRRVCANQKIRSDCFTSINLLGLIIILTLGGFIIFTSFSLPIIWKHLQQRRPKRLYGSLEWVTNEMLQLQRLAHEASGSGTWQDTHEDYPTTTAPSEQLAVLDVADPKHPTIKVGKEGAIPGQNVKDLNSKGPESPQTFSHVDEHVQA